MRTLSDFVAQKLSKTQMSSVKGGASFECVAFMSDGSKKTYKVEAESHLDAADTVHNQTGAGQVNCVEIH